ncbi:hypothetical protein CACET_c27090 [Clostridium aceticum]|uniref:Uncharacterized protein n=1 Tax=Clostridium aceticum TaxID=84022 RepID=A0A0G3WFF7_9CLOT|nr:hypothetical protein [Clostridium aceticum]AKL96154.1 hypothetical protein CACET_c27090 [Clostridium aceticum]
MSRKGVPNKMTKWETHILPHLSDIKDWLLEGATDKEICDRLDISHDTWYRYMKEHEILSELVSMGKSVMDSQVEKALFKLAIGYEYEEIRTIVEEDKNGKKRTRIEKIKRHQPANATALSFWLRNRQPEKWNERKEIILDTKDNEQARKKLFLEMIQDDIVEVDYSEVDEGSENNNTLDAPQGDEYTDQ